MTVTPVNDAPILTQIESQSIDEGGVLELTLSATDIDAGDLLVFDAISASGSNIFVSGDQLTITPQENYNGSFDVTVLVSDQGGLSDSQIFTLTVNPVNDPPIIEDVSNQQVAEDGSLEIPLFASDIDGDVLIFTADTDDNSSVSIVDNILTVSPAANYNGSLSITAYVSDDEYTDSTTFTVTVTINDAPVLTQIESQSIDEEGVLELTLSATDIDADDTLY